jgi:ribonuclease P protein component
MMPDRPASSWPRELAGPGGPVQFGAAPWAHDWHLRRQGDFRLVREQGRKQASRLVVATWIAAPDGVAKAAVVASRNYDRQAVGRNRARRLLREAFRLLRPGLTAPVWLVLVARWPLRTATTQEVQQELLTVLGRAGLLAAGARRP